MPLSITWTKLSSDPALKRSANSVAVVGDTAFIFGGENLPRTPVNNELYSLELTDGSLSTIPVATRPSARVGSALATINSKLFLWGGREGKDMSACNGDLWVYDIPTKQWSQLPAVDDDAPANRSFHTLAAQANQLYLHAGCPAKGRLETLHSLSVDESLQTSKPRWTTRSSAPPPGRGGTVLCPITLPNSGNNVLVRFGGFAGLEIGGAIDIYDVLRDEWTSVPLPEDASAPEARSVHGLIPLCYPRSACTPVAVMLFGERGPAPTHLGHDGAGQFHSDAWLLVADAEDQLTFTKLEQKADGALPAPRGWFASAAWGADSVVIIGGLDDANERLAEAWIGKLSV